MDALCCVPSSLAQSLCGVSVAGERDKHYMDRVYSRVWGTRDLVPKFPGVLKTLAYDTKPFSEVRNPSAGAGRENRKEETADFNL